MKKCANCGFESPDEALSCPSCSTDTFISTSPEALGHIISPEEQQFWERMTFREFAILIVRLQALWVLFPVVVELTYLPGYLSTFFPSRRFDVLPPDMKQTFYLGLFRIALRIAVGMGAFLYAERLLSWLAKGRLNNESHDSTA